MNFRRKIAQLKNATKVRLYIGLRSQKIAIARIAGENFLIANFIAMGFAKDITKGILKKHYKTFKPVIEYEENIIPGYKSAIIS